MHWRSSTATILAVGSFALLAGCSQKDIAKQGQPIQPVAAAPAPTPAATPVAAVKPATTVNASAASKQDPFREGVNRAASAVSIGQSAQSPEDWKLAASRWQQALTLMQKVPSTHPNYSKAQTKVKEYQQNLAAAQQRVKGVPQADVASTKKNSDGLVAQIPIVERRGGTPVVPVNFQGQNGKKQFTMLFDTGATGTLITQEMASALGVVIVGSTTVTIADGSQVSLPIGYVDVLEVGGLRKEGVLVAIGGDVGLLGQDVYGDYGISLGGNIINLYE
ncbi:MAG TPA: retropepsin-like aspartic protease [Trichocoleus sp.]